MWASSIQEVGNGNYNICGGYLDTRTDLYILQLSNSTGNILFDSIYAQTNFANAYDENFNDQAYYSSAKSTYIAGRMQKGSGQGTYRPSLSKLDSNNVLQWTKTYLYNSASTGGRLYSYSIDIDGDSLIFSILGKNAGITTPFQVGLIKTDTAGNVGWAKLYSGSGGEDLRSYSMISIPTGYIISGYTVSGNASLFMIKTDKSGNVLWSKKYGDSGDENVHLFNSNSRVIVDNNYAVTVGRSNSFNSNYDILLIKADLNTGNLVNSFCYAPLPITTTTLPTFHEDYPLISGKLPITLSVPADPAVVVQLNSSGSLIETISDTIVSNDTIYLCQGETVSVNADWNSTLSYLWSTGNTNQIDTLSATGTYWVDVTGAAGCLVWTDTVHVIVDTINVQLINDTTICGDGPIILNAFNSGASYLWHDNSTNSTFTTDTSGLFFVTATSGSCQVSDSVDIQFIEQPVANLGNDTTICLWSSTIVLDAGNTGFSYLWNTGSTGQLEFTDSTSHFWVVVSNGVCSDTDSVSITFLIDNIDLGPDTTICESDSITFDIGNSTNSILWSTGSTSSTAVVNSTDTYWVQISNGTCSVSDSIDIVALPAPTLNLGNDTSLCFPPILLYGQNPGATYNWSNGSLTQNITVSQSGIYWLNVAYGSCSVTDSIQVEFSQPTVHLGPDVTVCENSQLVLNAANPGSASYLWNDGSTGQTFAVPQSGLFHVTVYDNNGCYDSDTIEVAVQEIIADYGIQTQSGCAPVPASFTNLSYVNFGSIDAYNWQFGDGNTSLTENPIYTYNTSGLHSSSLSVTSNLGCTATFANPTDINVFPPATADFAISPKIGVVNQPLEFTNLSSNYSEWIWNFGDNNTSNALNPTHLYDYKGIYSVELIVLNEFNCSDTAELVFKIHDEFLIYAPNVFTPDQNNFNNDWKVYITGVNPYRYTVTVFDRWGEVIWLSQDYDEAWDGYYNGDLVQQGVYVWKIDYEQFGDSERHSHYGTVTVLP